MVFAADEPAFVGAVRQPGDAAGVVAAPGDLAGSAAAADAVGTAGRPTVVVHPGRRPAGDAIGAAAARTLWGRGVDGYRWALHHLAHRAAWPHATLRYGPGFDQVGDLRVPAGPGPHPVVVLVHGGFWLAPWERDLMEGLAVDLARRGAASWNLEYRRVGAGGGWPATADDVAAGIAHVRAIAGGHGLADGAVTLVGHSAGAHLALLAASRADVPMGRVVGLAPLTDLVAAARERLGGGAVERLVGDADPREASPVERLPLGVPQVLAHTRGDRLVPVDQTRRYAAAARGAGDPVDVLEFPGGDHFTLIDASSREWARVAATILPGDHGRPGDRRPGDGRPR